MITLLPIIYKDEFINVDYNTNGEKPLYSRQ